MTITTTPASLAVDRSDTPLIQNLGPATVYVGRNQGTLATTGIRLEEGDAVALAANLVEAGGPLYAVTTAGTADVRVLTIG